MAQEVEILPRGSKWPPHEDFGARSKYQVSQAGISNCIPQYSVGCNYLSLPEIPTSGAKVLLYCTLYTITVDRQLMQMIQCIGGHDIDQAFLKQWETHTLSIHSPLLPYDRQWCFLYHRRLNQDFGHSIERCDVTQLLPRSYDLVRTAIVEIRVKY